MNENNTEAKEALDEVVCEDKKSACDNCIALEKEIEELKVKLTDAEKKSQEYYSYLQRMQADFDNYRKIVMKEKEEIGKYITENIVCLLLPVIDNLDRACASIEKTKDIKKIKDGFSLILKQFNDFLSALQVKEIECSPESVFDPNLHEAVQYDETEKEDEENKILSIIQKGYILEDKPIRCAKVKVAKYCQKKNLGEEVKN